MSGVDLTGVSAIQVSPSGDVVALPGAGQPGAVTGVLTVGQYAQWGTRTLNVVTPAGQSNALTFNVGPPASGAPLISNLSLDSAYVGGSGYSHYVHYSGKLDFSDAEANITTGSKIYLLTDLGSGSEYIDLVVDDGSYLQQNGKSSGTISFSFQKSFGFLYLNLSGKITVLCMIQDAAGNLSNSLSAVVSTWDIPLL